MEYFYHFYQFYTLLRIPSLCDTSCYHAIHSKEIFSSVPLSQVSPLPIALHDNLYKQTNTFRLSKPESFKFINGIMKHRTCYQTDLLRFFLFTLEKFQCLFFWVQVGEVESITSWHVDSFIGSSWARVIECLELCQMKLAIYPPLIDKTVFPSSLNPAEESAYSVLYNNKKRCHIGNFLKIKNCPTWLEIWVTETMVQVTSVCRFVDCAHFQVFKNKRVILAGRSHASRNSHQKYG